MRRQLAMVSLAVTLLVVVAFLVPLALVVRNQAADRALSRAERDVQAIAAALAVAPATMGAEISRDLAADVLRAFRGEDAFTVVFPDGRTVGTDLGDSPGLAQARRGAAFSTEIEGGFEVLVPVLDTFDVPTPGETEPPVRTVVVRTVVSDAELRLGVTTAWGMLGALGVFLVVIAVIAADRLARNIVRPVDALSAAARSLGRGDLDTRVEPAGPLEVAQVGEAFNFLARRLVGLLNAERESVADLSHRLRTPLTALRLQTEMLSDPAEAAALSADIDRMGRAVDRMIEEARRPAETGEHSADLAAIVLHRATFWKVLADEQGRTATVETGGGSWWVPIAADELGAVVDTLIENVFAHTPAGTDYHISVRPVGGEVELVVEDQGPGLPEAAVIERGASSGGSTGLGLDIARRAAEKSGGDLMAANRPDGGAVITVRFGGIDAPLDAMAASPPAAQLL
ncbi:MAG: HAMP domain-containing histidine kinase [Acidimicrobiia bacterium]|nr:HAMP domain-containing histidine kinase [Acidimicrobiia bacterium]